MKRQEPDLWLKIKAHLKKELNEQAYRTWIEPTTISTIDEGSLTLSVPNKFSQEWLMDHYSELLSSVVRRVCDKDMELKFMIAPAGSRAQLENSYQGNLEAEIKSAIIKTERSKGPGRTDKMGLDAKYNFDSFVVGPGNRFAHAASVAVSESPARSYNPLFIYGGVGLGKTHLMHAVAHHVATTSPHLKVLYLASERFTNQLINAIQMRTTSKFRQMYRTVDVLLLDDIHFIAGKESTQEEFFHTFNTLYDDHKQIVISSDRPPKEIPGLEERLVSRFGWGLVTDIQPPDLETRIAILRKKAARETIKVPDDVTFFIADKIKTNIRELEGALIRVVAYSKLIGKSVDLVLVKEILKDMVTEEKKVTIDLIQRKVSEHFGIKPSEMRSKKRNRVVVYPRQVAMYLSRELTPLSLPEIGNYFGGRDHTTIIHACNKIGTELRKSKDTKKFINNILIDVKTG